MTAGTSVIDTHLRVKVACLPSRYKPLKRRFAIMVLHPSKTPRLQVHITDQLDSPPLILISIVHTIVCKIDSSNNHVYSTTHTSSAHDPAPRADAPDHSTYSSRS